MWKLKSVLLKRSATLMKCSRECSALVLQISFSVADGKNTLSPSHIISLNDSSWNVLCIAHNCKVIYSLIFALYQRVLKSEANLEVGLGTGNQCGTGSNTTGATRTETQRTFRCFFPVPEPIEMEKNYCCELLWWLRPVSRLRQPIIFNFESGGVAVCDSVSPCGAHQRQAGRDGETVTGPPKHVVTDDDEQPELRLVP